VSKSKTVGKLALFHDNWQKFTNDQWVLNAVSGYKIEFVQNPHQQSVPSGISFNDEQRSVVDNEVVQLLQKGAIVPSFHEENEFISNLFVVPKPNGKWRPILNLKYLNEFVVYNHFKLETFQLVLDLIQPDDFFTKIDLTDAYFSVPIHPESRKFLKFSWNGVLYEMTCLPFGISVAPFLFTKICKPVFSWFRAQSIRCTFYIDDSLGMNQSKHTCKENCKLMWKTLESLGFDINQKKSCLSPVQRIVFFGFVIDSVLYKVFLTDEKVEKMQNKAHELLSKEFVVVRQLASFIGLVINAFYAVFEAKLHYRYMEKDKILGLGNSDDFDNVIQLSHHCREEISWWFHNVRKRNGKRIRKKPVDYVCQTDASLKGYGCVDVKSGHFGSGRWTVNESLNSINYLELLAIFMALQTLYSSLKDVHIECQSDNVSAVAYINDMGGMKSEKMNALAIQIWSWCLDRDITLSSVHIPGVSNVQADFHSRHFSESTEWMLKHDIFLRLCKQTFEPDVDLFSSRLNKQLERFVSWVAEPGAFFVDAFSQSWCSLHPYMFPPFSLVGKVINKIVSDEVPMAILVFPYWPSSYWFPLVLECLCSLPIRIPRHKDLLVLPHNRKQHPLGKRLQMVAAVISGQLWRREAFHQELQDSFPSHGQQEQGSSIGMHGKSGVFGTVTGKIIPFSRLKLK